MFRKLVLGENWYMSKDKIQIFDKHKLEQEEEEKYVIY